jgi:hypothetical protein
MPPGEKKAWRVGSLVFSFCSAGMGVGVGTGWLFSMIVVHRQRLFRRTGGHTVGNVSCNDILRSVWLRFWVLKLLEMTILR